MHKFHVTVVALLLAGATVLGAVAVSRTTGLGAASRTANDAAVKAQTKQLVAFAAKLRQELKAKPPALPAMPKPSAAAPAAAAAAAPRIVYHQPPPIIIHKHHHGDDGSDGGGGGGDG